MEREVQGGTVVGFVEPEAKAEVKVEKPEAKPKKKK